MSLSTGKKVLLPVFLFTILGISAGCKTTAISPSEDSERVEIGYGDTDAENVTGSIATVRVEDKEKAGVRSAADILRCRAAGVHVTDVPGGGLRVSIRGGTSFRAGNNPLYVVDGFAVRAENGVLYGINPHDIESITVLKDAASTAIYGSRGANGVVIIKTKI